MQQLIMSEGFYSNPQQMKSLFSTLDYGKNENFLRGLICPLNYANNDMLEQMHFVIGAPQETFEFVEGSGAFIINTKNDLPSQSVCTNLPDMMTQWVGVVCLSEPEEPHFLKFYRNKTTGWDSLNNSPEEFQKNNINSYQDFENWLSSENENWEDKWTETTRIELGFNKLILFRPGMFHSYNDVYGDEQKTGRLLQFFFLKPKVVPQQS